MKTAGRGTAMTPKRKSKKANSTASALDGELDRYFDQKEDGLDDISAKGSDRPDHSDTEDMYGRQGADDIENEDEAAQSQCARQARQCDPTEDVAQRAFAPMGVPGDTAFARDDSSVQVAMPDRTNPTNNHDRHASHADRRIMGAAATIGGASGMLIMGPVTGTALCAAAAYATTREDSAGTVARRAGAAYVQATDRAVDKGLQLADRAVDEGLRRLSNKLQTIDPSVAPGPLQGPLRTGLRKVYETLRQDSRPGSIEDRKEEAKRMRAQYPDRVPVIVEKSPYCDLPEIDKKKFAVPGTMLCGEFKYIVHKHVAEAMGGKLRTEQTIYLFVNGIAPKTSTPMADLYTKLRGEDGFLYVRYGAENTLGGEL